MTRVARLAAFLRAHPHRWFDGRELATLGGSYAWRTRLSDLRRPPFRMAIRNRQRRTPSGVVLSEYAYIPAAAAATTPATEWALTP